MADPEQPESQADRPELPDLEFWPQLDFDPELMHNFDWLETGMVAHPSEHAPQDAQAQSVIPHMELEHVPYDHDLANPMPVHSFTAANVRHEHDTGVLSAEPHVNTVSGVEALCQCSGCIAYIVFSWLCDLVSSSYFVSCAGILSYSWLCRTGAFRCTI